MGARIWIVVISFAALIQSSSVRGQVINCEEVAASDEPAEAEGVPQPTVHDASIFATGPFTDVLDELVSDGFEKIEASISVDKDSAHVSWAPWVDREVSWSETRFGLTQKDDRSNFAVGFKYNPLAAMSKRGVDLWRSGDAVLEAKRAESEGVRLAIDQRIYKTKAALCTDERINELSDQQAQLTADLEELAKSDHSIEANRARYEERLGVLSEVTEELSLLRSIQTLMKQQARLEIDIARLAVTDLTVPASKATYQKKLAEWNDVRDKLSPLLAPYLAEISQLSQHRDQLAALLTKAYGERLVTYAAKLLESHKPILGLTTSAAVFSKVLGTDVDDDDDDFVDNEHEIARYGVALDSTWRWEEYVQLSIGGSVFRERTSAEEGNDLEDYWSVGATVGKGYLLDRDFAQTKAYKESLFVPLVTLGLSVTHLACDGEQGCKDLIERKTTFTPFVDFKIQKGVQFRIGLPYERRELAVGSDSEEVDLLASLGLQLTF